MEFTFHSAGEIVFGRGKLNELGGLTLRFGQRALLVTRGAAMEQNGIADRVRKISSNQRIDLFELNLLDQEPLADEIDRAVACLRGKKPHVLIAIGGGSTIDTAKALAGLATNPGDVLDYLEGMGRELVLQNPALPCIAIPTTAGTGAEVTKNAVITCSAPRSKRSLRSPLLIPRVALLDPELTVAVPSHITAETGMDALTQLIEAFTSKKSQPIPDALSLYGVRLVDRFLRRAVADGTDLEAREGMLLASLLSGLALANSGLGAVHGIAASLGGIMEIPHGRACAMLLPKIMQLNLSICEKKYAELAATLGLAKNECSKENARKLLEWVQNLTGDLAIEKKLPFVSMTPQLLRDLVQNSYGSSMSGNPIPLEQEQVEKVILDLY